MNVKKPGRFITAHHSWHIKERKLYYTQFLLIISTARLRRCCDFCILKLWLVAYSREFGGYSPNDVIHHLNSKKHILARKHVVWTIKHENLFTGSTWACDQKRDRTGQNWTVTNRLLYYGSRKAGLSLKINQSINQREICRAPLRDTSRSASNSQL